MSTGGSHRNPAKFGNFLKVRYKIHLSYSKSDDNGMWERQILVDGKMDGRAGNESRRLVIFIDDRDLKGSENNLPLFPRTILFLKSSTKILLF